MATANGGKACGLRTGSLSIGDVADLTVLDLSGLHNQPIHDPFTAIVSSAHASDVEAVVVDGRIVMKARTFTSVDEDWVLIEAKRRTRHVLERAGLA